MSVIAELSRRRVFRVAGLYVTAAWGITQAAEFLLPALSLPEWSLTLVVALLVLGFPLAMVLAWAFDIGPDGIVRTPGETGPAGRSAWQMPLLTVMLAAGTGLLVYVLQPGKLEASPRQARSIAVLPFENLSGDPSRDYFSDGMSEEIINLLARVPGLRVAARTSAFQFKGGGRDVREVAQHLGVDAVLEGSVRWAGDNVRISAQLIDAESGFHLWSEQYAQKLEDIFVVQDEISRAIVLALRNQLNGTATKQAALRVAPPTADMAAYQLYLRARHQFQQGGIAGLERSIELYEEALLADPNYARAFAGIAASHASLSRQGQTDPAAALASARTAARQALALDDSLAEAHAVLAYLHLLRWDWADAEAGFFFATTLDPGDTTALLWYASLMRQTGRIAEALDLSRQAYDKDPASPAVNEALALAQAWSGQNDAALESLHVAHELGLRSDTRFLELILARRGQLAAAPKKKRLAARTRASAPIATSVPATTAAESSAEYSQLVGPPAALSNAITGPPRAAADEDDNVPELQRRFALAVLAGRVSEALDLADELVDRKALDFSVLWLDEATSLRGHPAIQTLIDRAAMRNYWRSYGTPDLCEKESFLAECT